MQTMLGCLSAFTRWTENVGESCRDMYEHALAVATKIRMHHRVLEALLIRIFVSMLGQDFGTALLVSA